jgi:hypothetical protein
LEAANISIIDNAFIMMHEYITSDGLNLILVFQVLLVKDEIKESPDATRITDGVSMISVGIKDYVYIRK